MDVSIQTELRQTKLKVFSSEAHQQNTLWRTKSMYELAKNYNRKHPEARLIA